MTYNKTHPPSPTENLAFWLTADQDGCEIDSSCVHGSCHNWFGGYNCECDAGYETQTCNTCTTSLYMCSDLNSNSKLINFRNYCSFILFFKRSVIGRCWTTALDFFCRLLQSTTSQKRKRNADQWTPFCSLRIHKMTSILSLISCQALSRTGK